MSDMSRNTVESYFFPIDHELALNGLEIRLNPPSHLSPFKSIILHGHGFPEEGYNLLKPGDMEKPKRPTKTIRQIIVDKPVEKPVEIPRAPACYWCKKPSDNADPCYSCSSFKRDQMEILCMDCWRGFHSYFEKYPDKRQKMDFHTSGFQCKNCKVQSESECKVRQAKEKELDEKLFKQLDELFPGEEKVPEKKRK